MNAHTPFDANKDWTNPYCQNSSNDPMVDALLGNAYHVVRTVYCNLGNLKLIYDFLNQYGMVLGVQSEAELKALTTKAKYARIYGFSRAGDRQVTDYLYVEGDHTGIIPDDPEATGSWITVATSGSNGGSASPSEGAYIPWVYANGSATGGETTINVPDGTVGVPFIIVNGDMQYVGRGFEFNADNLSVTLAQPLEEGDEVVFLLTGVPAVPDNPNVNDWVQINWLYNNGAAVGGEQVISIPYTFQSIPAVYKNGLRLYKGLTTESYTADPDNQRILLTEPLATNDRLIVQIGGEAQVLEASDHTLQEVARAANVKDSEVIISTDTTQLLNGKRVVYSVSEQKAYGLPSLPTNVYISSVSNGQLTYNPGNITVALVPVPSAQVSDLENRLGSESGSGHIGTKVNYITAVIRTQHDFNADYISVKDWGAKGDGVTDDTNAIDAACAALTGTSLVTNFRRLYLPHGTYIYNGAGITLPSGTTICGEDLFTIIDASNNTNSGYLVTLVGFGARLETLRLKGNISNANLKGISSTYNTDNGGVVDAILEDFHYGIDIDKCWYSVYQNIRFRRSSSSVVLTGSHIRIGYNQPTEEVNNVNFSNIWMAEQQSHAVSVHCPTQVLTWNECSFETKGQSRIYFATTASVNTFTLNSCYIEGDVESSSYPYLVEGQTVNQVITCNDCMFRLGNTVSSLGKNITIYINGGWSNSPNVSLQGNSTKIILSKYRYLGTFSDAPDYGRTGDYDGSAMHTASMYVEARPMDVRDWNSIIPAMVNFKNHASTSPVAVFKVYIPAGSGNPRMMHLQINALTKAVSENYIQGNEQYLIGITLPETSTAGTGVLVTKVIGEASSGATLLATPAFTVTVNGYDAATDSVAYTISHAVADATRLGNTVYTLTGVYIDSGISSTTRRWRIQRM